MGGSINPSTDDPEFAQSPSHEFNFWMDPEASRAVLHAHWPRVAVTTVDISVKTRMDRELIEANPKEADGGAQYVAKYAEPVICGTSWRRRCVAGPTIITKWKKLYMDVDTDHGAGYGNTLTWRPGSQPGMGEIEWTCRMIWIRQILSGVCGTNDAANTGMKTSRIGRGRK